MSVLSISGVSCDGYQCVNDTTFAPNGTIIRLEYGCENETGEEDGCKQVMPFIYYNNCRPGFEISCQLRNCNF